MALDVQLQSAAPTAPDPLADAAALAAALAQADVPTLLMTYVELTRDEAMLDRFAPHIGQAFAPPPPPPSDELLADLRAKLAKALAERPRHDELPPRALLQKIMSVGVGQPVDEEFIPLLLDQMGLERPVPRKHRAERPAPSSDFRVLVIGAGLTGLAAGIKLDEAGYDYVIVEKNPEVGGTWYENTYPGVGVDTPSHFYSYSFALNAEWNHYYPRGRDMQAYFLRIADQYDLRRNILFETKVTSCRWDDTRRRWRVALLRPDGSRESLEVNAVINAHGPVNRWSWPKIPGFDSFTGARLHTAAWDHGVDLKGKNVVVVGTGASAAQLVPAIAEQAGRLTVMMRSRHWVIPPADHGSIVPEAVKWAMRHIPHYAEWFRFKTYWAAGDGLFPNVLKDPEWPASETSVSALNEGTRQWALGYLNTVFADRPDLIEKLTPDFPIFSKRIVLDAGWFQALRRDNVDLEVETIDHIDANGLVLKDGRRVEADVIVCATGFDVAKMVGSLEIVGRDGRSLGEEWGEDDPRAYLGVTVPGYPNFFLTVGPNSAPNHAAGQNLISETQIHYIIECLDLMRAQGGEAIEPTKAAFTAWNERIDARMGQMIWTHPKANSYYNNKKGRVFLSFPWRLVDYWTWTRSPDPSALQIS
ncbi:NAD(P)/FAD-dependent oxidoreductase [Caulobacter sp. Root342]|uniref:flavin-containing monooxygenase n=1 Tax=Caulobacter sp. Root342 TaxID=1736519 RepID=UPI0006FA01B5|nr:NAD(P)/FAD-dependent oxidoreductase [Caulobacter sp. Root342]KQV54737.1 FAD-dependent oxidoreductase [Caulobacter sp. Root342]